MTQISDGLKYILIAFCVFCFLFMPFFLFFTETFATATQWPWIDPFFGRFHGIILLVFGVTSISAVFKKEWEQIEIFIEVLMLWALSIIILTMIATLMASFVMVSLVLIWSQAGILGTFLLLFLFYYFIRNR